MRLPKEFRFDTDEVRVRRQGNRIILEPIAKDWNWLDDIVGPIDDDFARAATDQPGDQERDSLDFFK